MRYVAAYLLAVLGGNQNPDSATIKKILEQSEVSVDEDKLAKLLGELEGKDIAELLEEGKKKISSTSMRAAPATGSAPTTGTTTTASAPAEDEPEEDVCIMTIRQKSDSNVG